MNDNEELPVEVVTTKPLPRIRLFRRSSIDFGIRESEIATVAAWRELAPLPRAPESVLGVACIQGRMLTVLDLVGLLSNQTGTKTKSAQHIVSLRGDEQLGLAADAIGEAVNVSTEAIRGFEQSSPLVSGVFEHQGNQIRILNVKELFRSSVLGRERRHRRF